MNYTENYHLPQWEETDRILRTDFNEAMENIEAGIADAAASYAAGSYTGTGAELKVVTGFRPKMLLIHGIRTNTQAQETDFTVCFLKSPSKNTLTYADDGFILSPYLAAYFPYVNTKGRTYAYIAFR